MTFPLFKRWYYNATGLTSTGRKSNNGESYQLNSNTPNSGSQPLSRSKNARNYPHPLSLPNDTAWGSDDAIMTVNVDGKKDGMGKSSYKSSKDSLDLVRAEVGLANPQNTSNVISETRLSDEAMKLSDIVVTREWGVTEAYDQEREQNQEGHLGSKEHRT